jgi:hypothetical protein
MAVRDSLSDDEFAAFLTSCRSESATKQQAFADVTRGASRWLYDLSDQSLAIGDVVYDMTPIGTHSVAYGSWLWAWANEDFPESARVASSRIQGLHGTTGFRVFVTPGIGASAKDADDFAALAVHILNARAFFRCPSDGPTLFLAVHDPRPTAG